MPALPAARSQPTPGLVLRVEGAGPGAVLDGVTLAMGPGGTRRRVALRELQSREPLALDLARVHIQCGVGLATGAAAGRALAEIAAACAGSRPRRRP